MILKNHFVPPYYMNSYSSPATYQPTAYPWMTFFTSPCLDFFTYKMEKIALRSQGGCEDQMS